MQVNAAKYGKEPAPIDFAAYKNKLRFTGSAVATLEVLFSSFASLKFVASVLMSLFCFLFFLHPQNAYKSQQLPTYTATLPAFEVKKRAMVVSPSAILYILWSVLHCAYVELKSEHRA